MHRLICFGFLLTVTTISQAQQDRYTKPIQYFAVSTTAMGITGDVGFSDTKLKIRHRIYPLTLVHSLSNSELLDAAKLFSFVGTPTERDGFLFRTSIPRNAPMEGRNTACGSKDVTWLLVEIIGKNRDSLNIAFFSGSKVPDISPASIDTSTDLCGTYSYEKQ